MRKGKNTEGNQKEWLGSNGFVQFGEKKKSIETCPVVAKSILGFGERFQPTVPKLESGEEYFRRYLENIQVY